MAARSIASVVALGQKRAGMTPTRTRRHHASDTKPGLRGPEHKDLPSATVPAFRLRQALEEIQLDALAADLLHGLLPALADLS
jgi:hypothetical protein